MLFFNISSKQRRIAGSTISRTCSTQNHQQQVPIKHDWWCRRSQRCSLAGWQVTWTVPEQVTPRVTWLSLMFEEHPLKSDWVHLEQNSHLFLCPEPVSRPITWLIRSICWFTLCSHAHICSTLNHNDSSYKPGAISPPCSGSRRPVAPRSVAPMPWWHLLRKPVAETRRLIRSTAGFIPQCRLCAHLCAHLCEYCSNTTWWMN